MPESPDSLRVFTYEEALEAFPAVRELTADAVRRVESLFQRVQSQGELDRRHGELETATQEVVDGWVRQMEDLGCQVKGLWLVDFDNGAGYYCWRWPEASLAHFHGYEEGFAGRVPIQ